MVRVRFHNGYESELREAMADRLAAKGELVILEAVKQEQPELELEAKKEPEPVKVEKPTNEPNRHGVKRR